MMTSLSSLMINHTIQSPPLQSSKVHPLLLLEALTQATVAAIPRTRSAIIQHALRCFISIDILATSPSIAVEFNQYIDALSVLKTLFPDPWRDFEIANADPALKIETIGGKLWLSHIDISQIQLVTEEWFRLPPDPKTESIFLVISTSRVKVHPGKCIRHPIQPNEGICNIRAVSKEPIRHPTDPCESPHRPGPHG